jgi:hypothetical protein
LGWGFSLLYTIKHAKAGGVGHRHRAWSSSYAKVYEPYMPSSGRPPNSPAALPTLVGAYVEATNSSDLDGLLATFVDDALVNDQLRDYWGKAAIRKWAERDIIGERLRMDVTEVIEHYGNYIVTANVDGNFDKRGLPDPLVLAFYVTPHRNRIVQLIILRNRFDI